VVRAAGAEADSPAQRLDQLSRLARSFGAGGPAWAHPADGSWQSPIAKF
jgi:hypothetical protein